MIPIYCISGLAADHRLFAKLSISGYELVPLPWVPHSADDNMASYAQKIAKGVTDEHAIVMGLSFGGMLATELARMHPGWKVFLVSSAKTTAELGYDSAFLRAISEREILPAALFNKPYFPVLFMLGATSDEDKQLLNQVIKDSDPVFNRWCVNTILNWSNDSFTANITHIHGTADKVIRSGNVHPNYWVEGGSHIMIYNRAAEVSKIISDCLAF